MKKKSSGKKKRSTLTPVKSGINLINLSGPATKTQSTFVTSRFARVLLAGSGFLADAYDLFVINLVLRLLRDEYPEYTNGGSLHSFQGTVAAAALFGAIIGQLVAGSLADVIGRKKIFVATAVLITIGSFGSALSFDTPNFSVYSQISCWRFILGAGVGGEYPLAATVTSESSSAARRGSLMAGVFSMQGVGSLLSVCVVISCLSLGFSNAFTWRFALAFGAMPAVLAFPFRLRMHETETFERVKQERVEASIEGTISPASSTGRMSVEESLEVRRLNNSNFKLSAMQFGNSTDNISPMSTSPTSSSTLLANAPAGYASISQSDPQVVNDNSNNPSSENGMLREANIGSNSSSNLDNNSHPLKPTDKKIAATAVSPSIMSFFSMSRCKELNKAFTRYKWHVFGTSLSWFLLDVDFYANGLFNHDVTAMILTVKGAKTTALQDACNAAILCIIGLPGYYLSVRYIDTFGRKQLQMFGFMVMAALFFICCLSYEWLMDESAGSYRKFLFLLLYALTFLFSNFGPNTTSFVVPGEIFPPEVRATCHGISAASGKLGAAFGAFFFPIIMGSNTHDGGSPSTAGMKAAMLICSLIAVLGAIVTYFFVPTYDSSNLDSDDSYIELDHDCLRNAAPKSKRHPPKRGSLYGGGAVVAGPGGRDLDGGGRFEMVEVVDATHDFYLYGEDGGEE